MAYKAHVDLAPKVVASGRGEIARKIIEKAQAYDIPLFQNELLADSLLKLDINESVPPALYQALADVFVWLMRNEKYASMSK